MDKGKNREAVDRFAVELIRRKAGKLVGRFGLTQQDREDLEQELLLGLWERLPNFDSRLSTREAFAREVVEHKVVSIIRERIAEMRDYRVCTRSLNERYKCDDVPEGRELQDLITEEQVRERLGLFGCSAEDMVSLRKDVPAVLAHIPPDLAWLGRRLMARTVTEISRETGIPRSTLYHWMKKLRSEFESNGFGTSF